MKEVQDLKLEVDQVTNFSSLLNSQTGSGERKGEPTSAGSHDCQLAESDYDPGGNREFFRIEIFSAKAKKVHANPIH